jgi:hypothetical protein
MPVVGFSELHKHATDLRYGLPVVDVSALPIARGIIEVAAEIDAPVVLAVCGSHLSDGILPSLEAMARGAHSPIGLVGKRIENTEQATLAIRLGCNGLVLADGLSDHVSSEIRSIAISCGIIVIEQQALTGSLLDIEEELESVTLNAIPQALASWQQIDDSVAQAAAKHLRIVFNKLGASGQGHAVLNSCKPWRPVEHLIVYNTTTDDITSVELAAEGRRVLDRIPGVRATWSGQAVTADAGYRWCWLIRFAHPAVIDSYREHPDHVAYADNHFRPVAGNRISIDYELIGADESWKNQDQ